MRNAEPGVESGAYLNLDVLAANVWRPSSLARLELPPRIGRLGRHHHVDYPRRLHGARPVELPEFLALRIPHRELRDPAHVLAENHLELDPVVRDRLADRDLSIAFERLAEFLEPEDQADDDQTDDACERERQHDHDPP